MLRTVEPDVYDQLWAAASGGPPDSVPTDHPVRALPGPLPPHRPGVRRRRPADGDRLPRRVNATQWYHTGSSKSERRRRRRQRPGYVPDRTRRRLSRLQLGGETRRPRVLVPAHEQPRGPPQTERSGVNSTSADGARSRGESTTRVLTRTAIDLGAGAHYEPDIPERRRRGELDARSAHRSLTPVPIRERRTALGVPPRSRGRGCQRCTASGIRAACPRFFPRVRRVVSVHRQRQ